MPDPALASLWEHCRGITLAVEEAGFDNVLLPSGYALGIDSVAFAAGVAPLLRRMRLLLAVRLGEMWVPQLARQLATIDQMLDGRLTVNTKTRLIPLLDALQTAGLITREPTRPTAAPAPAQLTTAGRECHTDARADIRAMEEQFEPTN